MTHFPNPGVFFCIGSRTTLTLPFLSRLFIQLLNLPISGILAHPHNPLVVWLTLPSHAPQLLQTLVFGPASHRY